MNKTNKDYMLNQPATKADIERLEKQIQELRTTMKYQCQSYVSDTGELKDCTCGKCEVTNTVSAVKEPQWPPVKDQEVWIVNSYGNIYRCEYTDDSFDRNSLKLGLCFLTKKAAERRLLQLKASANTWMPKDGESYWFWSTNNNGPDTYNWRSDTLDLASYYTGNVHRTKEEALAWYKEYKDLFDE